MQAYLKRWRAAIPKSQSQRHCRFREYLATQHNPWLELTPDEYKRIESNIGLKPAVVDLTVEQLAEAGQLRVSRGCEGTIISAITN